MVEAPHLAPALIAAIALVAAGCATKGPPAPSASAPAILAQQKAEVAAVLGPLAAERTAQERAAADQDEAAFDAMFAGQDRAEQAALEPLAARGNAEAMHRLAKRLRDSDVASDVRRWLALETAAARQGHTEAHDELARWYWHQRGDGSIEDVQRNRARALDHAGQAAAGGQTHSISRIGIYIAGDVHQYPANPELAREVLALCARAGQPLCMEQMALPSSYDYGLAPAERRAWLTRLATRQPVRFGPAAGSLTGEEQTAAADWTPTPWTALDREWTDLRQRILAHGATSVGADAACTTMTPWCRGALAGR